MTARWAATTTSQQTATGRQHLLVPAMFSVCVRLSSLLFFSLCRLCVSVCICVTGKTTRDMMKTIRGVKLRGTKSRQPQKQTRRAKLLQRRHKGTATCDRLPSPRSKNEKFRECTQELAAGSQVNRDYNNTNAYFSGALKEGNHSPRLNQTRRDTSHRMILERVVFFFAKRRRIENIPWKSIHQDKVGPSVVEREERYMENYDVGMCRMWLHPLLSSPSIRLCTNPSGWDQRFPPQMETVTPQIFFFFRY